MIPQKDRYHLERLSTGGKSEFETFRNEQDNLHYFHFNDENGQALLYSQGYKDARSRNSGIQAVEKNAHRIEHHLDGDCHYFVIRSGNRQEIARSREFGDAEEMEAAVARMQRTLLAGAAIGATTASPAKPTPPAAKPAVKHETPHQPSRYRFSLELQHRGQNEPLFGVIEYPVTGDKATFKGIDTDAISQFISKFAAPPPAKKSIPAPPALPPQSKELLLTSAEGQIIGESLLQNDEMLEIRMLLSEAADATLVGEATFMAKVYARSLDSGDNILISNQQGFVSGAGDIALPVSLNKLSPGSYRLVTDVDLHAGGRIKHLEGSRLMHLAS